MSDDARSAGEDVAETQPAYVSERRGGVLYERFVGGDASEFARPVPVLRTMPHMLETGVFWYGDNLEVMREHLGGEREVDLIYLNPPFNSKRAYSMFFKEADDTGSQAQRTSYVELFARRRRKGWACHGDEVGAN